MVPSFDPSNSGLEIVVKFKHALHGHLPILFRASPYPSGKGGFVEIVEHNGESTPRALQRPNVACSHSLVFCF